jgi:hypothetical protein
VGFEHTTSCIRGKRLRLDRLRTNNAEANIEILYIESVFLCKGTRQKPLVYMYEYILRVTYLLGPNFRALIKKMRLYGGILCIIKPPCYLAGTQIFMR